MSNTHVQQADPVAEGVCRAFVALDARIPQSEAASISAAIVGTMSGDHRVYHDMNHVSGVVPQDPEDDPLSHLAAIFHDIIHLPVDGNIPSCVLSSLIRARLVPLPCGTQLARVCAHGAASNKAEPLQLRWSNNNNNSSSSSSSSRSSSESSTYSDNGDDSGDPEFPADATHRIPGDALPRLLCQGSGLAREREEMLCKPKSLALLALSQRQEADSHTYAVADEVLSWWSQLPADACDSATQRRRQKAQKICYKVFGHEPGHVLDFSANTPGLSEFLSCVVAMDLLSPWLNELQLLHVCACIEATIPFRAPGCFDQLWLRCMQIAVEDIEYFGQMPRMSIASQMHTVVESACRMASRDLGNFASQDTREFLANTWALLPELNPALRCPRTFTLRKWMQALAGNIGFFEFLGKQPERVFHRFGDSHSREEHEQVLHRARTNLQRGRMYIGARLVTAGIIHALLERADKTRDRSGVERLFARGVGGSNSDRRGAGMRPGSSGFNSDEFNDQGADAVAYVEQLLLQGFGGEKSTMKMSASAKRCLYSSVCEASAFVLRSITLSQRQEGEEQAENRRKKERRGCAEERFERCVKSALAYFRDEMTGLALLQSLPSPCVDYLATSVVPNLVVDH